MKYHLIEPEAIVGLGQDTIMNSESYPPVVSYLHIEIEDWLGDDLMEVFPCYLITEMLAQGLKKSNLSGFDIRNLTLSKAEYFQNNYKLQKNLPEFFWLNVTGKIDIDDFYINNNLKLLVSDRALNYLKNGFTVDYAEIDSKDNFDDLFVGL